MEEYLTEGDDKFVVRWTLRRYIGRGTPPREFATVEEQLEFIRATPGAIGYVDDTIDIQPGLRLLFKYSEGLRSIQP